MKKLFLVISALFTGASFLFAANINTEVDLSYTCAAHYLNLQNQNGSISVESPIGVNTNAVLYYMSPNQTVDLGVGVNFGLEGYDSGLNITAGLAPVFRFNLGSFTSLYVAPGFAADSFGLNIPGNYTSIFDVSFELDGGYRGWFVTGENFNMGVCADYKIGIPFLGTATSNKGTYNIFGGLNQNFSVGLCMNFGTKSDAKRATFRKVN